MPGVLRLRPLRGLRRTGSGPVAPERRRRVGGGRPRQSRFQRADRLMSLSRRRANARRRTTEYPANGSLTFHHARSVSSRASEKNIYGQASRLISIGKLNASPRLYTRPIDLVIFQEPLGILRSREISSCGGFHAYMLSAFLPSGRSYPALPLAR